MIASRQVCQVNASFPKAFFRFQTDEAISAENEPIGVIDRFAADEYDRVSTQFSRVRVRSEKREGLGAMFFFNVANVEERLECVGILVALFQRVDRQPASN